MEKRNSNRRNSVVEEKRVKLEPPASVRLQSQFPGTVIVIGVSGKRYVFPNAGVIVEVDAEDAPKMLEKTYGGNSCCGSGVTPLHHFIVV